MQSDRNTFYGDVVLDSFNKASRDEDNILDQIKAIIFGFLLWRFHILKVLEENAYLR